MLVIVYFTRLVVFTVYLCKFPVVKKRDFRFSEGRKLLRKIRIMPGEEEKPEEKKKLKPCCACPETKRARDTW